MSKTLKFEVEMSIYQSIDILKNGDVIEEISKQMSSALREIGNQAVASMIPKQVKMLFLFFYIKRN